MCRVYALTHLVILNLRCDLVNDPADRVKVVQRFLCISKPGNKLVQVSVEILCLSQCVFQFGLKNSGKYLIKTCQK